MKVRLIVAFAVVACLVYLTSSEAFARKEQVQVSPHNAKTEGFAIIAKPAKEVGATTFIISRDLSKAKSFGPDSDLTNRRDATLRVYGDAGLVIECRLEPEIEKNVLKYRVTLARNLLAHAHLTISEVDDYKNVEGREHLLGGGTFYELTLDNFIAK